MSSLPSSAGKFKRLKTNADGEAISSTKNIKQNKMNVEGGAGGAGSSSAGAGTVPSATRPQQQQLAANNDSRAVQPALHLSSDEVNYLVFRSVRQIKLFIQIARLFVPSRTDSCPDRFCERYFLLVHCDFAVSHLLDMFSPNILTLCFP